VVSTVHLKEHCLIVKELYLRREIIKGLTQLLGTAQDMSMDIADVVCEMQELATRVEKDAVKADNLRNMETLMNDTLTQAKGRIENSTNGVTGTDTGLTDLNKITGGWQRGDLVVIAARPATRQKHFGRRHHTRTNKKGGRTIRNRGYKVTILGRRRQNTHFF
jgi:replicative DNA helicase